ncbi:MAG: TIM44-like domain-containing protein [Oscillospiraceae bacterium]|nr:TIM44-like domain-containing protein [Oscillospiraceae bacterium]
MKRSKIKISIILAAVICLCFLFVICASADVGNFNDWGDGGGSDWGGDWSGGGDSFITDMFWNTGSGGNGISVIGIIIFVVVVFVIIKRSKGNTRTGTFTPGTPVQMMPSLPVNRNDAIEAEIKQKDPEFTSEKAVGYANEVFVKLQEAWTKRDWHIVRVFESEALFNVHNAQLDEYKRNKQTNVIERVCVNNSYLCGYQNDGTKERLDIFLEAAMNDYLTDDLTGKVVKGNKDTRYTMRYKLEFIRSSGVKTSVSQQTTTNCPNCGAPTEITSSGQCEYCHSVITTGDHGWVLNRMERVR